MIKKIGFISLIIMIFLCITGCNNETEEERLKRETRETEQGVRDAQKEYNDTEKAVNDYNRYRNSVNNTK